MKRLLVGRYLLCPCAHWAPFAALTITVGGKRVEVAYGRLCLPDERDFTCLLDVSAYAGHADVEVRVERVPTDRVAPLADYDDARWEALAAGLVNSDVAATAAGYSTVGRPLVHFTQRTGWLNDPNGLLWHEGTYHLYFQSSPLSLTHVDGNNHWGHAVSCDLFHWQEQPPVLRGGDDCSGSGFVHAQTGRPWIACRHVLYESGDKGFTYVPRTHNPYSVCDPKVFYYPPTGRYIAISLGTDDSYVFSSSGDLVHWREESRLAGFHECPDLFELPVEDSGETKWVLHGGDAAYCLGRFDGHSFRPDPLDPRRADAFRPIHDNSRRLQERQDKYNGYWVNPYAVTDWGTAYAFQSFSHQPEGRVLRIGWLKADYAAAGLPFSQCMTIPQEVHLRYTRYGLRLCALPAREIETAYDESWSACGIGANLTREQGRAFDVKVVMADDQVCRLNDFTFSYDRTGQCLHIRQTGQPDFTVPYPHTDGLLVLRAVLDSGSAECFWGEGEAYLPLLTSPMSSGLQLRVSGGTFSTRLVVHTLRRTVGTEEVVAGQTD